MNDSYHTYEQVIAHIWMSHITHMNESHHTNKWDLSRMGPKASLGSWTLGGKGSTNLLYVIFSISSNGSMSSNIPRRRSSFTSAVSLKSICICRVRLVYECLYFTQHIPRRRKPCTSAVSLNSICWVHLVYEYVYFQSTHPKAPQPVDLLPCRCNLHVEFNQ